LTLVTKEPAPAEINACLNPLILAFNNRAVEPADDGGTPLPDDFAEFREDPYLLDIQPAFQPDDLPRARLLAEVHRRKSLAGAVGPNAPAIPRLLFGPNEAVGVLPFLMLDAFRGTFVLDGLSSGAAGWNWYPPSGRPDADNRWLIQHSLARLGIPMGEG
jgi:hypothetical protein